MPGFERIALFSDPYGAPMGLDLIEPGKIACLVVASIRPQHLEHVSRLASEHGIRVLVQPRRDHATYATFLAELAGTQPDLILCNSYSMLIPDDVLSLVRGNALNVHAALLPSNRGPNPIQWALIRGETTTGVTIHYMVGTVDAGDIVAQRAIDIGDQDTWVTLRDRLTVETRLLLREALPEIIRGTNRRQPQCESMATSNRRLNPDSPKIDFDTMTDRQVFDLIRAQVRPLGGAYVETDSGRIHFPEFVPLRDIPELRRRFTVARASPGT